MNVLEAAALGWKTRRIIRSKEIQNRIKQVRDYENAEEETLIEAKKPSTNAEERQNLLNLIEGFRLSRESTVIKLIKLVHSMHQKGLWITYATAEQADTSLRTPRKSVTSEYLKRGARTSVKEIKQPNRDNPFLKVESPAKNLDVQSKQNIRHSFTGAARNGFGMQSIPERRSVA